MKEIAKLFKEQCIGSRNGEMALINFNPVIRSLFDCCGYEDYKDGSFQKLIRSFADELDIIEEEKKKNQQDIPF